jgi:hypothetical protein
MFQSFNERRLFAQSHRHRKLRQRLPVIISRNLILQTPQVYFSLQVR